MLKRLCLVVALAVATILPVQFASAAALLPWGKQQYVDANGAPCVGCKVYFYIPGTTTPKDTWTDADQSTLNTNPVILDSLGTATIYGSGTYRQILRDASNNTLWDAVTSDGLSLNPTWGGISTGAPNVLTLTVDNFDQTDGQIVSFLSGFTNTGATTLNVNGLGAAEIVKDTAIGPQSLAIGDIVVGNAVQVLYSTVTGQFHLITPTPTTSFDSAVFFNGILTPTILAADQNDYTPPGVYSGANTLRLSSTGSVSITGLTGGTSGRFLILRNIGTSNITLVSNSTSSTAVNRFLFPAPVVLRPYTAQTIQYDTVSSGWGLTQSFVPQPTPSAHTNLVITNGATPNNQRAGTATAAILQDTTGQTVRRTSLSCVADVTASGAGGLDSGSVANNTWYSYWFIFNPATNTDSCLLSTSATSPTLPTGYTFSARFGWARTDGSAHFRPVIQKGTKACYSSSRPIIASGSSGDPSVPTWTAFSVVGAEVPTTASEITVNFWKQATANSMAIAPNNGYDSMTSSTNAPPLTLIGSVQGTGSGTLLLESSSIYYASSSGSAGMAAYCWTDNL